MSMKISCIKILPSVKYNNYHLFRPQSFVMNLTLYISCKFGVANQIGVDLSYEVNSHLFTE